MTSSANENAVNNSGVNKKRLVAGLVLGCLVLFCWEDVIVAPVTRATANWNDDKTHRIRSHPPIYNIPDQELRSTIRRWGCGRRESPLIFVHIGKAGGGSVRTRLATAAVNFTKGKEWHNDFGSYYPVSETEKARFCNSCFSNRRPSLEQSYEGTVGCHATTPIGNAIACPEGLARLDQVIARSACSQNSATCHMVYAGHNWLGAEFHWLPRKHLVNWWDSLQRPEPKIPWHRLDPSQIWCDQANVSRPLQNFQHEQLYETCSLPLAQQVDAMASVALSPHHDGVIHSSPPLYASLPVLRVTVLRDPFSWLMSKFFWHHHENTMTCDDISQAIGHSTKESIPPDLPRPQLFFENGQPGWVPLFCFEYLSCICGEDCAVRYASGRANWDILEQQAEENLRHSFAVVGILEEIDDFYTMINARVHYMDTASHKIAKMEQHSTSTTGEASRCKQRYKDSAFQQELLAASPELRAIHRLYQVGVEVKRFQWQELQECFVASFR